MPVGSFNIETISHAVNFAGLTLHILNFEL